MGPAEILLILALALILLGPKRLPEAARQVGKILGEIRRTTDDLRRTLDQEVRDEEREKRLAEYRERQQKAQAARLEALKGTGEGEGEGTTVELPGAPPRVAMTDSGSMPGAPFAAPPSADEEVAP